MKKLSHTPEAVRSCRRRDQERADKILQNQKFVSRGHTVERLKRELKKSERLGDKEEPVEVEAESNTSIENLIGASRHLTWKTTLMHVF